MAHSPWQDLWNVYNGVTLWILLGSSIHGNNIGDLSTSLTPYLLYSLIQFRCIIHCFSSKFMSDEFTSPVLVLVMCLTEMFRSFLKYLNLYFSIVTDLLLVDLLQSSILHTVLKKSVNDLDSAFKLRLESSTVTSTFGIVDILNIIELLFITMIVVYWSESTLQKFSCNTRHSCSGTVI